MCVGRPMRGNFAWYNTKYYVLSVLLGVKKNRISRKQRCILETNRSNCFVLLVPIVAVRGKLVAFVFLYENIDDTEISHRVYFWPLRQ